MGMGFVTQNVMVKVVGVRETLLLETVAEVIVRGEGLIDLEKELDPRVADAQV